MDAEEFIEAAMRIGYFSRKEAEEILRNKPNDIPLEDVTEDALRGGLLFAKHHYGDRPKR